MPRFARFVAFVFAMGWGSLSAFAEEPKPLRTFFVTRSLTHEKLLPFLKEARPQVVQIGNYGAMFHGYADNKKSTGWPMQLPMVGERESLAYQKKLNRQVHDLDLKVVGVFRLTKVMGHWKDQTGFVDYYNNHWPTDLLGPKPHPKLEELLQRDAKGEPIQLGRYNQSQLALCISSPHARKMLKQMLKVAVDQDIDGVITTYNYRFNCACPHCQSAFKKWLKSRYTAEEILANLSIKNLDQHTFEKIPAKISGYPDPKTATVLDWLAMRWGAEHFKEKFDEIFLDYGRSLKKDLLVAQWNHLGHVSETEERMFLPIKLYAKGEDYVWYSGGASFVGKNLNLKEGKAGDAWLSCLYVREMTGGKTFVMGKYERTRLAVSMAEGYATGGMGMGRYMRFEDPIGYEVLSRYTNFMHKYRKYYDEAKPYADAALILPNVHVSGNHGIRINGMVIPGSPNKLAAFRNLGQAMLERHVLFDVVSEENKSPKRTSQFLAEIFPLRSAGIGSDSEDSIVVSWTTKSHKKFFDFNWNKYSPDKPKEAAKSIAKAIYESGGSKIEAPWTVRAAAYTQPKRLMLHLVNYDREEGAPENNRTGPEAERPKPVKNIACDLRLPADVKPGRVMLLRPDVKEPLLLKFDTKPGRVSFEVPEVKVYGVLVIENE